MTHREYLEWCTKHEPESPMNHKGSAQVKILVIILKFSTLQSGLKGSANKRGGGSEKQLKVN